MGLFGKLFDKKECAICGGEIGLLGNRKLDDGNMCKNCAALLSPYLNDRRHCTVEDIKAHLAYRADNERKVARFTPTRVFGDNLKVYIDDNMGGFIISRYNNFREDNPDIIPMAQVLQCRFEIDDHKHQIYHKSPDGKQVPFNPPRYDFDYEFEIFLTIDNPWFQDIRFELTSRRPDRRVSPEFRRYEDMAIELCCALDPKYARPIPVQTPNVAAAVNGVMDAIAGWACPSCGKRNRGKFCEGCGAKKPAKAVAYACDKCGWAPENPAQPPKFCPQCGDPFDEDDAVQ